MKFSELSETAKQNAHNEWVGAGKYHYDGWEECDLNDFTFVLEAIGMQDLRIGFDVSYSQGDGACFIGSYRYAAGALDKVKKYMPDQKEVHEFVQALTALQKRYFYNIYAQIKKNGSHHEHAHSVSFYLESYRSVSCIDGAYDEFTELMRDFMNYMFREFEKSYSALSTYQNFVDTIEQNEDEDYNEEGKLISEITDEE